MLGHIEQESSENYLETIFLLTSERDLVRAIDVAKQLNLSRASVSRALSLLKAKEYITISNGAITLTQKGSVEAQRVLHIHRLLVSLFVGLAQVSEDIAAVDACRIEHVVSQETVEAIKLFLEQRNIKVGSFNESESYIPDPPDFSESAENYLETIYVLKQKLQDKVKAVNIAKELNVSRASVSTALGLLREKQCLTTAEDGYLAFTEQGLERAKRVYARHQDLSSFFKNFLKIEEAIAEKDACRIEHLISKETITGIRRFMQSAGN